MRRIKFSSLPQPYLATIIIEACVEDTIASIQKAYQDGAQAFVVALYHFPADELSLESLQRIPACAPCPMMALAYRNSQMNSEKYTDEQRADVLIRAVEAGFSACDLMGDLFDPSPRELTRNPNAIARQMELIDIIHGKGGEVLMSSHMPEPLDAEAVLEHLLCQQSRGIDIAKIVVTCDTESELVESAKTTLLLKEKMTIPFIHLCNGHFGRIQRYISPLLGGTLTFAVSDHKRTESTAQAGTAFARRVLDDLMWETHDD